jgi:four helix bundle protein
MLNNISDNSAQNKKYDLEERTAKFGEDIIEFCRKITRDEIIKRIISQLIGAGTAVGTNYCEADCAEINKDFIHKMGITNKEAKESKHFLRMPSKACPEHSEEGRKLWKEAHELNMIFTTIIKKVKNTEEKKKIS